MQNELILKILNIKCIISLQDSYSIRITSDSSNLKYNLNDQIIIKINDSEDENL